MKNLTLQQIGQWILALIIACIMGTIGNFVGYGVAFMDSLPGMAVLFCVALLALILKQLIPTPLPALVYASMIGILIALPFSPISEMINPLVSNINLMAIVTPILAYAGLTVGRDWAEFKHLGWRAILVGLVVIFSSFFWAACLAQLLMKLTGVI